LLWLTTFWIELNKQTKIIVTNQEKLAQNGNKYAISENTFIHPMDELNPIFTHEKRAV
jgi:hypothetical protein